MLKRILAILVVVFIAYSAGWWYVATELKNTVEQKICSPKNIIGLNLECGFVDVGNYPKTPVVEVRNARLNLGSVTLSSELDPIVISLKSSLFTLGESYLVHVTFPEQLKWNDRDLASDIAIELNSAELEIDKSYKKLDLSFSAKDVFTWKSVNRNILLYQMDKISVSSSTPLINKQKTPDNFTLEVTASNARMPASSHVDNYLKKGAISEDDAPRLLKFFENLNEKMGDFEYFVVIEAKPEPEFLLEPGYDKARFKLVEASIQNNLFKIFGDADIYFVDEGVKMPTGHIRVGVEHFPELVNAYAEFLVEIAAIEHGIETPELTNEQKVAFQSIGRDFASEIGTIYNQGNDIMLTLAREPGNLPTLGNKPLLMVNIPLAKAQLKLSKLLDSLFESSPAIELNAAELNADSALTTDE